MHGHAVMGEQGVQERAEHTPLWGPSLSSRINTVEVMFPTFTTWGGRPFKVCKLSYVLDAQQPSPSGPFFEVFKV